MATFRTPTVWKTHSTGQVAASNVGVVYHKRLVEVKVHQTTLLLLTIKCSGAVLFGYTATVAALKTECSVGPT